MLGLERVLVEHGRSSPRARPSSAVIRSTRSRDAHRAPAREPAGETENGNGNGHAAVVEVAEAVEEEPEDELGLLEREPDEDTDEHVLRRA